MKNKGIHILTLRRAITSVQWIRTAMKNVAGGKEKGSKGNKKGAISRLGHLTGIELTYPKGVQLMPSYH
jgi:hypothetical protein